MLHLRYIKRAHTSRLTLPSPCTLISFHVASRKTPLDILRFILHSINSYILILKQKNPKNNINSEQKYFSKASYEICMEFGAVDVR